MSVAQLDFYFPFIVWFYGLVMTLVLGNEYLMRLARNRLPLEQYQKFTAHKGLGLVCLIVGSLWSLQNLWFS